MNKLKVDFIAELLSNKRISVSDKERLFALSLNELKKISNTDDEIRQEIADIKKLIYNNFNNDVNTANIDTVQQPSKFNGIFCGKELTIIVDGKTENSMPLCNPSTKEILFEMPCIVFYKNGTIVAKIIDNGLEKVNKDIVETLEIKIIEALRRELERYRNSISENTKANFASDQNVSLLPHNPLYTVAFLKKFKIGDGSGFKELVHDVMLSGELINEILTKVKSHPNFISYYKKERVSNISFLNRGIVIETRTLIDKFEKEGIPFFNETGKHPYNNDKKYTSYAKDFKTKYRYGSGSEYSKFQIDILKAFNEVNFPTSVVSFLPNERNFNIRTSFFTWQPSIYEGLRYIIQGIRDHTNIDGTSSFDVHEKEISVEAERVQRNDVNFLEIRIFDLKSVSKIDSDLLLHFFKESSAYKTDFRSLCDWTVECDFLEESSKRFNLLVAPDFPEPPEQVQDVTSPIGGFKHTLRFYDIR